MASYGSWPSIKKHGLLSTGELLALYEIGAAQRVELLTAQRLRCVPISHPNHGVATIRDQKPLSAKNLARCLKGCDAPTWYSILNDRVFFWLNRKRLLTLMSARDYAERPHTILQVDTARLVRDYQKRIELAHMNTGNTLPFPHPRGRSTFRKLEEYPYEKRRNLPDYSAVVELTVLSGVPDVREYVTRVEHAQGVRGEYQVIDRLL
jgi:hypothetical protein